VIKAVTFDLDGTLVDSTEAIVESFFHTFERLGIRPPERDRIVQTIGYTLEEQFSLFTDHDPAACTRVYRAHYETIACAKSVLLPGAAESLERFDEAGLRLGFATSKRLKYAVMILEHLGILDYFTSQIGPDEVTYPKPHPEAVLKSLNHLNVAADEMFFVGDTHFDVLAARDARVRCLCVTTGYNSREELCVLRPEAVFDSLSELTEYALKHRSGEPCFLNDAE